MIEDKKMNEYIINKQMRVEKKDDAVVLPVKDRLGGILSNDGQFVASSYHDGEFLKIGGKYDDFIEPEYFEQEVYFGGYFIQQWGHFLLDSLSRLWAINNYPKIKIIILKLHSDYAIKENYYRTYELLGITKDRIIEVDRPMKFKRIYIPSACCFSDRTYTYDYVNIINTIINNAMNIHRYDNKKIYFTRTCLNSAKLKEVGEKDIESFFRSNNFLIISPEKIDLDSIISIFQRADLVVCLNGSIALNVIFGKKKMKFLVLNKTSLKHDNLYSVLGIHGINPQYLNVYNEPFKALPNCLGKGPFWIDVNNNDIEIYAKKNNLVYLKNNSLRTFKNRTIYYIYCLLRIFKDCFDKIKYSIK